MGHNPLKESVTYWCQKCDAKQVTNDNPKTGRFFLQHGHEFHTGEYTSVFYALCVDCLNSKREPLE